MTSTTDPVDSNTSDSATPQDALGDGGKKALEAERKARRDAERKLQTATERVAELEAAELRRDVAADRGLTAAQAARLRGTTREEMDADAEELLELLKPAGATPPPSIRPTSDLRGGTDPTDTGSGDAARIADRILGGGV